LLQQLREFDLLEARVPPIDEHGYGVGPGRRLGVRGHGVNDLTVRLAEHPHVGRTARWRRHESAGGA
jgi:hypothetical protein